MWPLERPAINVEDTFDASKRRLRNINGVRDRLTNVRQQILDLMAGYSEHGDATELHQIHPNVATAGVITKEEMLRLYSSGLVQGKFGRPIYDALMALAPNGRCSYCGHRRVRQLDHFLPKAKYPAFSVTPLNLVPSCTDCNKDKLAGDADVIEQIPLHPYFESVDDLPWLQAEVLEGPLAVFVFSVSEDADLDECDKQRLVLQFNQLGLDELYAAEANDLLCSIRLTLRKQHDIDGAHSTKIYLEDEFLSARADRLNSWRTAFFEAASMSDWFCDGGFDDPELPAE